MCGLCVRIPSTQALGRNPTMRFQAPMPLQKAMRPFSGIINPRLPFLKAMTWFRNEVFNYILHKVSIVYDNRVKRCLAACKEKPSYPIASFLL